MKETFGKKLNGFEISLHAHEPLTIELLNYAELYDGKFYLPVLQKLLKLRRLP